MFDSFLNGLDKMWNMLNSLPVWALVLLIIFTIICAVVLWSFITRD